LVDNHSDFWNYLIPLLKNNQETALYLSPARYVIWIFGGVHATARAIQRSPSSVVRWKTPVSKRGCGGRIPSTVQYLILEIARVRKLDIRPEDLLAGRHIPKSEIEE